MNVARVLTCSFLWAALLGCVPERVSGECTSTGNSFCDGDWAYACVLECDRAGFTCAGHWETNRCTAAQHCESDRHSARCVEGAEVFDAGWTAADGGAPADGG